ncbi:MAG: tRNA (adenosine(37)-N6)-threonylcarbamoyltransferase complex ATPase subunit type 1 TsaE [Bacteroidales bacterium]|nr:tRNA (adenosine(37)-N6)-threonylcarbamoyltransferase complex ATPase subunit type 1 TsaE [Bacteroidales bacterium]
MRSLTIPSLNELSAVAGQFLQLTRGTRKFAIHGKMGAGKTTFIKAVCDELGAKEVVNSPSFSIINEYQSGSGMSIYHIDLYRIRDKEELFDLGYEDYFYSNAYVFIEWPENAGELLPQDIIRVNIEEVENGGRIISIIDN